jgi:UDP-N-acetylglucosamine acyltransferase
MIHPTAQVDPGARIGARVQVGAFSIIGPDVDVGDGTTIGSHCVIEGPTRIGADNRIYSHAALGTDPQDKKYAGERAELVIGDRNTIREFTTFSRGTGDGGGVTRIGDDNWIMAYVHIAHDCIVGSNTIFANNATLAGHAEVGDWAILGGFVGVHQFCRIGAHAMIAAGSIVLQDVPPFVIAAGYPAKPRGINSEGLRRRGFSPEDIAAIRRGYKVLYRSKLPLEEARNALRAEASTVRVLAILSEFLETTERGMIR